MDLKERLDRHIAYKKRYLAMCSRWRIKYGQYMQRDRERAGISLREMAKAVGKSSSTIFAMEQGATYWTPEIAGRYLAVVEKQKAANLLENHPVVLEEENGIPSNP
jgi:ribosome-binding protein aMBF1 (putative translation factor)